MEKSIHELIREAEQADKFGSTNTSKYVQINMREDIETTEAYLNSKHISGDTDHLGREKPFFNIVIAARNIWFRATDLDIKNIKIIAERAVQAIPALLATIKLQMWLKKVNFGKFLNDWGITLASHGSAVTKFVEKDGELYPSVLDWNHLIVDPIDFENNLKIEKLWFTPAQLRKNKSYDKNLVKKLLEDVQTRKTIDGQQKDTKQGYIPVYEVHGELEEELLTGKEGDESYVQQMHVVTFLENKEKDGYDDYTLYKGRETKSPYKITHLLPKDGQTYTGGAVKNLFEAQWMVNDSAKKIKDQLELASKIVFQTSDDSFVGQNVLTSIENGDILKHSLNQPITMLNNKPDIGSMQSNSQDWRSNGALINGISEAMMGVNPPSGSAWRQTEALLQENHSLFEIMTENKGVALKEMLTEFVVPFFKKQLNDSEELAAILEDSQIKEIDSMYLPNETIRRVNRKKIDMILSGEIYDPENEPMDMAQTEQSVKGELNGNQRFIKPSEIESKTWKELFKDLEWVLDYEITGESKDVQGALATLTTAFQTVVSNPGALQDPNARMIFNKILGLVGGISPLEIQTVQSLPQPQMPQQMPQPELTA